MFVEHITPGMAKELARALTELVEHNSQLSTIELRADNNTGELESIEVIGHCRSIYVGKNPETADPP